MPWFFNKHPLLLHRLKTKEDPLTVPLNFVVFWIQIHDLHSGLISEAMAKRFGMFLGELLEYDTWIPSMGFQRFICLKVKIDVLKPLKRRKKVQVGTNLFMHDFIMRNSIFLLYLWEARP